MIAESSSRTILGVGIVGAGRMGYIRATSALRDGRTRVTAVFDPETAAARRLAEQVGAQTVSRIEDLIEEPTVQIVVVATPHKFLAGNAQRALHAGKHVFCEKPMARNPAEAAALAHYCSRRQSPVAVVGFTLRHHPGIAEAYRLVQAGTIGELLFVRARYGHGGRAGYDKEWRADREISGGGELLDQGVHLLDLSRCFLGDFDQVSGLLPTYCWGGKERHDPVEDNAFLLLRTRSGQVAQLHASWTQWKNLFAIEVFGSKGSVTVEGLGGSYGQERLVHIRRRAQGGVPDVEENFFLQEESDDAWRREWSALLDAIEGKAAAGLASATPRDAWEVLRLVQKLYNSRESVCCLNMTQPAGFVMQSKGEKQRRNP